MRKKLKTKKIQIRISKQQKTELKSKAQKLGIITPTLKIPTNFEMFQTYIKFLKNIFGFIVDGVIVSPTTFYDVPNSA